MSVREGASGVSVVGRVSFATQLISHCLQVFVTAHQSVADVSKQMLQELKRHNYVTPTNYLETVRGYRYAIYRCLGMLPASHSTSI